MKENIFDVLMYLFENYMEDEIEMLPDSDVIRTELQEAGFESCEVNKAFDWLDSLSLQRAIKPTVAPAFRIFCASGNRQNLILNAAILLCFLNKTAF